MLAHLVVASLLVQLSQRPQVMAGTEQAFRVSDDGQVVAFRVVQSWRVSDWKPTASGPVFCTFDHRPGRIRILDTSQLAHVSLNVGTQSEDDNVNFTLRSADLWGIAYGNLHFDRAEKLLPSGSFVIGFLHRRARGEHPNREAILRTPDALGTRLGALAFESPTRLLASCFRLESAPATAPSKSGRITLSGYQIDERGSVRQRYRLALSTNFGEPSGIGTVISFSVDGLAWRDRSDPKRLIYVNGPTARRIHIQVPNGENADRLTLTRSDVFVYSAPTQTTLRYSLSAKRWLRSFKNLRLVAVSGNGKWGALGGIPSYVRVLRL